MADGSSNNILIVDDTPENITILRQMLADEEYRVRPALSGEIALNAVEAEIPDLILMDIMMPGVDGFEVCSRLKASKKTRDVPVLFISALNEMEDKIRGFRVGGVDFITKPFHAAEVLARVKTHLALRNMQKKVEEQNLRLVDEIEVRKQAETALEKANGELQRLASLDGLTKIPNRRRFDEYLTQEWNRAKREGTPVSIILGDIDHFKKYNDTYGHLAGDEVLGEIAEILRQERRASDILFRYGGEEFLIVLPEVGLDEALVPVERIRTAVEAAGIANENSPAKVVTISAGIAELDLSDRIDLDGWLKSADAALYVAKENGRNQIATAPLPPR